jgi:hypothetical protein
VLFADGFRDARGLAAALRQIIVYQLEVPRPWASHLKAVDNRMVHEQGQLIGNDVARWQTLAKTTSKRIVAPPAALLSAFYVLDVWATKVEISDELLDWVTGLSTGASLPSKDVRLALCSWWSNGSKLYPRQTRQELFFNLILRAFHAQVQGEELGRMLVRNPATFVYRVPE